MGLRVEDSRLSLLALDGDLPFQQITLRNNGVPPKKTKLLHLFIPCINPCRVVS
jgi:hypothetical protein